MESRPYTRSSIVVGRFGIGGSVLAGWMRAAGVDKDGPLCESDAREWRANPDPAPGWLCRSSTPGSRRDDSAKPELVRAMLAIVTSFAGTLYGQRPAKAGRLPAVMAAKTRSSVAA